MSAPFDYFVYWLINADGDCVYVGSSHDPERRWREHYRRIGDEVVTRRVAGPFTRKDGLALELAEQKRLTPKYNGVLKTLPVRFSTWGADCSKCPDEDVLYRASELLAEKWMARKRDSWKQAS